MKTTNQDEVYSVEIPLKLYFKTDEPVAIKDIAQSLLAIERLAKRLPGMLTELSGVEIERYELSVSRIESGSLIEALGLMVFLSTPEQRQALFDFLEHNPMGKPLKITLVGLLALLLISESYQLLTQFTKDDAPSIQANHNTIINITAGELGTTPEAVEDMLNHATQGNRKELVKAAMGVVKPIENHRDASLHASEATSNVAIPPEAMREVPFDADLNAHEHDIDYENVLLQIRALDRDSTESGWRGLLPNVLGEKRMKLYFDEGLDTRLATTHPEVRVDATVTYRNDINKAALVPKHITITRVYPIER